MESKDNLMPTTNGRLILTSLMPTTNQKTSYFD